jgi:hypothetical protein
MPEAKPRMYWPIPRSRDGVSREDISMRTLGRFEGMVSSKTLVAEDYNDSKYAA